MEGSVKQVILPPQSESAGMWAGAGLIQGVSPVGDQPQQKYLSPG